MTADTPLTTERDKYRKTAMELTDLIRDLEAFADKFKDFAQNLAEQTDPPGIHADAQRAYRDLATLIELAARLAHPQ